MKIKKHLITFLSVTSFLSVCASAQDTTMPQEIRIQLSSTSSLSPLYVSNMFCDDSSFSANYIKELEHVFDFDFCHNGKTKIVTRNSQKESLLAQKDPTAAFAIKEWKAVGIPYVVKLSIKNKKIQASVCNVVTGSLKVFPEVPLDGNLSSDRRQLHKLSDGIYKILFASEGITNSRILFSFNNKPSTDSAKSISEIWECDWDGANAKPVTRENTYCVTPVLIPKGGHFNKDMFLYVSYKSGQPKIFISSVEEGRGMKAVDIRGNQLLPAISKQRDQMAFICDASGRADLFVQPIRPENGQMGTPVQLFSFPRSTQASPTFSPDGSKIAFASDKDGSTRIYMISSQRSEKRSTPQLLTKKNRENSCPCWSPDGTKLAYSAKTDGIRQIWIYDFSSGEETQLTFGGGNKENPCWASNSLHLVFNSTDASTSDLYMVNLNQPEVVKITHGPGKKHYPTWGPR
jgi:TolB protein